MKRGYNLSAMKWKQFRNKIFQGLIIIALATIVLLSFADVKPTNWLGYFSDNRIYYPVHRSLIQTLSLGQAY